MTHTRTSHHLGRLAIVLATVVAALGGAVRADALAARLFTVVSATGMVCEIDPVTGVEISSFMTPGTGVHAGLAFNGTELFYTDETLGVVKVYLPDGTFVRDIAKPGIGPTAGAGLGVSATSLFGVGVGDDTITAVDPGDGSFQSSFGLSQAKSALTFAGTRGSIFVRVGDSAAIDEVRADGTLLNTITGPVNVSGLAYSSSLNRLFAVVTGTLYAMDPDTGALLPGYPVSITDHLGNHVPKTGGAAADESMPPPFCGDGIVQPDLGEDCEPPGTATCDVGCRFREICFNFTDDDHDGLIDCLDPDCQCGPIGKDPGVIRFAAKESGRDFLGLHGRVQPTTTIAPATEEIGLLLTNAHGIVLQALLPPGSLTARGAHLFKYRNNALKAGGQGILRLEVRNFESRGHYQFRFNAYGDLSAATEPMMDLQVRIGDDSFLNEGVWQRTGNGWVLALPGE